MSLGYSKGKELVNRLRHSYLNVMKLENYGPTGECLNDNHQTFSVFLIITFKIQKVQNSRPHFGILIKNHIKYYVL